MSVANIVVENLPIAGAAGGALVGFATEQAAILRANQHREALSAVVEDLPVQKPTVMRRLGSAVVWGAAGFGMLNGVLWSPDTQTENPDLHMIVDHSGATAVVEPRSIEGINNIVREVADSKGLDATIHVASLGTVKTLDVQDALNNQPSGSAPLAEAFSRAADSVAEKRREMVGSNKTQSTGIFVVTNGNPLSPDAATTITRAQELNAPVFIANVEGETTSPETTESLKAIADQTEGGYWAVDQSNVPDILDKIDDSLKDAQLITDQPSRLPYQIAAAAMSGVFLAQSYRRRAENTTGTTIGRQ